MKSKQLANVLMKILGISVLLHGIPSFVSGFIIGLSSLGAVGGSSAYGRSWAYTGAAVVEVILAIFLIVKSRKIADILFKGEDE
jgi:hypothetical protein